MGGLRRREATLHRELRKAARASQEQMWQVHGRSRVPGRQSYRDRVVSRRGSYWPSDGAKGWRAERGAQDERCGDGG